MRPVGGLFKETVTTEARAARRLAASVCRVTMSLQPPAVTVFRLLLYRWIYRGKFESDKYKR